MASTLLFHKAQCCYKKQACILQKEAWAWAVVKLSIAKGKTVCLAMKNGLETPCLHASLQAGGKPLLGKCRGCIHILSQCQGLDALHASLDPAMHIRQRFEGCVDACWHRRAGQTVVFTSACTGP